MNKEIPQKDRLLELVRRSPFVFVGTIKAIGTSSLKALPAERSTATVRVDDALWSPIVVGKLKGKTITIRLTKGNLKPGEKAIFFATSWLYAEGIAVVEVDRLVGKIDGRTFRQRIADTRIALLDQATIARLENAELVISGIVVKVERLGKEQQPEPDEVETEWRKATVLVSTIEKGRLRDSPEVNVIFPEDSEERWAEAPRFREGQQGIWILSKYKEDEGKRDQHRDLALTALDPLDFHLLNQIDRLRALLAHSGYKGGR